MALLEKTYRNMQDVEFTIEDGQLFMLQTRNGMRSAERCCGSRSIWSTRGCWRPERRCLARRGRQVRQLLLPRLDSPASPRPRRNGVQASPGAATGDVVFSADEAERRGRAGESVILVRDETTPDDFHGMVAAKGILTSRGGKTSHAAIVAVGMGTPAVTGVTDLWSTIRRGHA